MTLRLVVFDVDGTLVDSQADILSAMGAAFALAGQTAPDRDQILGIVGLSLPEAMGALAPELSEKTRAGMVDAYKVAYMQLRAEMGVEKSSPLYPHVRDVLGRLHGQDNTLLGLATGKSRRGLDKLVEGHDLGRLFVTRQCADDHPSKPHPSMLQAALSETGVRADQAVMVGDTSYDMQMARAAGLTAVGVTWGYHTRDRLAEAHAVIDDIRDLPMLLDQLWGPDR